MVQSPARLVPPFCPNPRCKYHSNSTGWRYRRIGFYTRSHAPRRVQRYLCTHCRRAFSSQTFATTYWLKRPDLLPHVFDRINACECLRQIARSLGVSPSTVMKHVERLGRHCLLFHHQQRPRQAPGEPVVIDGFVSFEFSQYYPTAINVAVGADSQFFYAFTDAELRRRGRMKPYQKRKRQREEEHFGRPDPKAEEREMGELLELMFPEPGNVTVRSDEHPAYPRALRRLPALAVDHQVTSSKAPRTARNPLFVVNRLDLLLRHSGANHKRETIAYSKRRQAMAERVAMFAVWHNFQKHGSEKRRDGPPAERLGLRTGLLSTAQLLGRRLFARRIRLPARWQRYYDREIVTRRIPEGRRHRLTYAY